MREGWESEARNWARLARAPGLDHSHEDINRPAVTHPERETAVLADAARLPFPDEAFDLVVAYMSLHDIDEMPQAVAEAARVLGRCGRSSRGERQQAGRAGQQ